MRITIQIKYGHMIHKGQSFSLLSSGVYAEMWDNGIIFARQKAF
jgi:hypothetical protein